MWKPSQYKRKPLSKRSIQPLPNITIINPLPDPRVKNSPKYKSETIPLTWVKKHTPPNIDQYFPSQLRWNKKRAAKPKQTANVELDEEI